MQNEELVITGDKEKRKAPEQSISLQISLSLEGKGIGNGDNGRSSGNRNNDGNGNWDEDKLREVKKMSLLQLQIEETKKIGYKIEGFNEYSISEAASVPMAGSSNKILEHDRKLCSVSSLFSLSECDSGREAEMTPKPPPALSTNRKLQCTIVVKEEEEAEPPQVHLLLTMD
ncbi:hypothetical protein Moror_329 [Moniliophthora roreri MCA 2997]|uniref:Uncharacterized protein n=1 Tax=Moniliophthora roreri (strain MCA 2997) TaxID=1381753 RepID=V2Y0A6_MONRO|nr:hypothetical protein Moror_329 [Moniliophthora roreri MCA 2997]